MFFDPIYLLLPIPALFTELWAIRRGNSSRREARSIVLRYSGSESASRILTSSGVRDVSITRIEGCLTDLFDPDQRTLRLSNSVHDGKTIDSIAIASHEAGFAIENRWIARIRMRLWILGLYGTSVSWLLLVASVALTNVPIFLAWVGLITLNVSIQAAMLPIEVRVNRRVFSILAPSLDLNDGELESLQNEMRARTLKSIASTFTGAFLEIVISAYHKLFR